MEVLKKSAAIPVDIISGCQQIKPSTKAKHAAGIYSSDEEKSKSESEDANAKTGSKGKTGKDKANSTSNNKISYIDNI